MPAKSFFGAWLVCRPSRQHLDFQQACGGACQLVWLERYLGVARVQLVASSWTAFVSRRWHPQQFWRLGHHSQL